MKKPNKGITIYYKIYERLKSLIKEGIYIYLTAKKLKFLKIFYNIYNKMRRRSGALDSSSLESYIKVFKILYPP